jgi:hypothetical protein
MAENKVTQLKPQGAKAASVPVGDAPDAAPTSPAAPPAKAAKSGALPPLPKLPKAGKKAKPPKECFCGCGEMTKGGTYVAGHDGRLKGLAIRVERKVMTLDDVETYVEQVQPGRGKATRAAVEKLLLTPKKESAKQ